MGVGCVAEVQQKMHFHPFICWRLLAVINKVLLILVTVCIKRANTHELLAEWWLNLMKCDKNPNRRKLAFKVKVGGFTTAL